MKIVLALIITVTLVGCASLSTQSFNNEPSKVDEAVVQQIREFASCPDKVEIGVFLDGGTTGAKAYFSDKIFYFGLDNPSQLIINNSERTLVEKDVVYIKNNKLIKAFIGAAHPSFQNAHLLPFKGEEEAILHKSINDWLGCENLDEKEKIEIKEFLSDLDKTRERPVYYNFDEPDRVLERWRKENSRSAISGENVENNYIVVSGQILATEKMQTPKACGDRTKCHSSWYKYHLKVDLAKDKTLKGMAIDAVIKKPYDYSKIDGSTGLFVISEIPGEKARNVFNAKYYLHEIVWPTEIYCFNNKLDDIGVKSMNTIRYRPYGDWQNECITLDDDTQWRNWPPEQNKN